MAVRPRCRAWRCEASARLPGSPTLDYTGTTGFRTHLHRHALEHVRPSCPRTTSSARTTAAARAAAAAPGAGVAAGGAVGRRPCMLLSSATAAAALLHVHLGDDALQAPCAFFVVVQERYECKRVFCAAGFGFPRRGQGTEKSRSLRHLLDTMPCVPFSSESSHTPLDRF